MNGRLSAARAQEIMDGWAPRAACKDTDPESFFPEVGQPVNEAKKVCEATCPVRQQCLRWALGLDGNNPEREGVWGGKSRRERDKIRRELGLTKPPAKREQVAS